MKVDPIKNDLAIIELLCQILATQKMTTLLIIASSGKGDKEKELLIADLDKEIQTSTGEIKKYLFEHFGKTPDIG